MSYSDFIENFATIKEHNSYSHEMLALLRSDLSKALSPSDFAESITVVTTGSFGRDEASRESDLDFFIFFNSDRSDDVLEPDQRKIREIARKHVAKVEGDTGTFGTEALLSFNSMLKNIGGESDSNITLTRRMLFLLEGNWLYGNKRFTTYRRDLLARYIRPTNPQNRIARFLLNDIIRYYRTITTDYEHKVVEKNKPWGLRNAKLKFSRKLLYFGGLIAVAQTAHFDNDGKIEELQRLFEIPALERIWTIGQANPYTAELFNSYENFLARIGNPEVRAELEVMKEVDKYESKTFSEIREIAQNFSELLILWLREQYKEDSSGQPHPIHDAMLF